jgi:GNAT acetyltransferase-like protein
MTATRPRIITQTIAGFTEAREAAEAEFSARCIAQPLPHRADWQRAHGATETLFVVARTDDGEPIRSVSASIGLSRALPGHRVYRVERFSACKSPDADEAALTALAAVAHGDSRCLRLIVEIFERDGVVRPRLRRVLESLGFSRAPRGRMYERTRGFDLARPSADLMAALHKTARRNIRSPARRGLEVRPITDIAMAPRLGELMRQAFTRTGSVESRRPWRELIALSTTHPKCSRLAGLVDPNVPGPEGLLAFAWGCCHGSYASYEEGASGRRADLAGTSLGYAPLWDLIVWANEQTDAAWFDLGGVSAGGAGTAQWGIAEFKRYFARDLIDVGEEWHIEPYKVSAAIARGVSHAAHWIDDVWRTNAARGAVALGDGLTSSGDATDGTGFEPAIPVKGNTLSRRAP